ncbi:MAG: hypothetical protein OQK05_01325 [Pseudopelagicola sp.]|nr:hypothetical protein [Pseudopelagicola sp.]
MTKKQPIVRCLSDKELQLELQALAENPLEPKKQVDAMNALKLANGEP